MTRLMFTVSLVESVSRLMTVVRAITAFIQFTTNFFKYVSACQRKQVSQKYIDHHPKQ